MPKTPFKPSGLAGLISIGIAILVEVIAVAIVDYFKKSSDNKRHDE